MLTVDDEVFDAGALIASGQRRNEHPAEMALILAMLERARIDLAGCRRPDRRHRILYFDAFRWVAARSCELHGFDWVCSVLGLDAAATAHALLRSAGSLGPGQRTVRGRYNAGLGRKRMAA